MTTDLLTLACVAVSGTQEGPFVRVTVGQDNILTLAEWGQLRAVIDVLHAADARHAADRAEIDKLRGLLGPHYATQTAPARPVASGVSDRPCHECGVHHRLSEFPIGSRVRTLVDRNDHVESIPGGAICIVREWSQYGSPIYYRVHIDGESSRRDNYSPCELEAVP